MLVQPQARSGQPQQARGEPHVIGMDVRQQDFANVRPANSRGIHGARERRVLFSGDQMLEDISPNIGWHEDRDPLGEFLASLDALARLEIELILPSHGAPFSGHREWIRKTIEHHADRCARILKLLESTPKSAADVADQLWERPFTPFHYRFAVFEVLAHLEYMERQGRVVRLEGTDIQRWRPASVRSA